MADFGRVRGSRGSRVDVNEGAEREERMEVDEGRCCACCHLWAKVPPDPFSWQAAYFPNIVSSPINTVCSIFYRSF